VRKDKVRLELRREGDRYLPIDLVVFHPDVRSSQSTLYVASTETTREQYKFVMDELPPAVEDADGLQFPATNVTWEQARMFCERVDAALGREDEVVRLPLESEWRSLAGPKPPENLEHIAVYGNKEAKAPAQVKTKLAYPDGIYDLRGNVWEWLWPDRDSSLGPAGGSQSTLRVALGGSWVDAADQLETEFRLVHNGSYAMIGFRIVVIPAGK